MIVPNPDRSLNGGALAAMEWSAEGRNNGDDTYYVQLLKATCDHYGIDMDAPWKKLNDAQREIVLYGSGDEKIPVKYQNRLGDQRIYQTTFEGVINNLRRRYLDTTSDYIRSKIEGYMAQVPCPACQRQTPEARCAGGNRRRTRHSGDHLHAGGAFAGVGEVAQG